MEERISELQDKSIEIIQSEEQREKLLKKNEQSFRGLWGEMNCISQHVMGGPEEVRQRKGQKKYQGGQECSNFEVLFTTLLCMWKVRGHWGVMRGPVSLNSELPLGEGQLYQRCTGNPALGYIRPLAVSRSPSAVP